MTTVQLKLMEHFIALGWNVELPNEHRRVPVARCYNEHADVEVALDWPLHVRQASGDPVAVGKLIDAARGVERRAEILDLVRRAR